jgi:hypothetical protein
MGSSKFRNLLGIHLTHGVASYEGQWIARHGPW